MKTDEKFVTAIFNEIFNDNLQSYIKDISREPDAGNDSYARIRNVLHTLNDEGKKAIFDFMEVVIADTASTIFGALDGTHFPKGIDSDFKLLSDEEEISGDLQDIFIEKAELRGVYK